MRTGFAQSHSPDLLFLPIRLGKGVFEVVAVPDVEGSGVKGIGLLQVGGGKAKATDQGQAGFFHDAAGGEIFLIGCRYNTLYGRFREGFFDERADAFGGIALAPGSAAQTVA